MRCSDNELEILEEAIQENIEWLETTNGEEIEAISIENLESILSKFFNTVITLKHTK
jgi:hypothetical protein